MPTNTTTSVTSLPREAGIPNGDGVPSYPVTIGQWKAAQAAGGGLARLLSLVASERASNQHTHIWISLATDEQIQEQWANLTSLSSPESLPLHGVPFAAKDNIDAKSFVTTAACPAFSSSAATDDSPVVARLKAAGGILIGKTNLDQFATGLVGTRSPHGAVPNSFDPTRVSGGSSSGSAVAVARGVVPFSLGTDTAGSGRVPAGLNNIYGLKPTRGAISARGVIPACRSLDCVSIFALTVDDTELVLSIAEGFDTRDAYSRLRPFPQVPTGLGSRQLDIGSSPVKRTLAVCKTPPWFDKTESSVAYERALQKSIKLGWTIVPTDFTKLFSLAQLLYEGPWVAERYAAIHDFIEKAAVNEMDPTVRSIISRAKNFSAADAFAAEYMRQDLTREIQMAFDRFDGLLVPTSPTFPTLEEVANDPVNENSKLGTYTNFVNFLDWSAIAIPAGFRTDGLPFGITLISNKWQEPELLMLARQWTAGEIRHLGSTKVAWTDPAQTESDASPAGPKTIPIVVVGAHLRGFPLNGDLISRGATFNRVTSTSASYRLFALASTSPRKPGMRHILPGEQGQEIEVEVWNLPEENLASFLVTIPSPLTIGLIELREGDSVHGFLCESSGLQNATDISEFGGWRAYMKTVQPLPPPSLTRRINTVLIANRGEIAVRILKTLRKSNMRAVSIYSNADAEAPHVRNADIALRLEGSTVADTYLNADQILKLAQRVSVDAIIPGYGFLSENADFARAVEEAGIVWVGPTPDQMTELGLKHRARSIAAAAGVPTVPGSNQLLTTLEDALQEAQRIGFPLMLKSTAGGGGIGLRRCANTEELTLAFDGVKRLATANFADSGVFIERYIQHARHVEVQVVGDGTGRVIAAGERDCSLQRRHQKVVEESPALMVSPDIRASMRDAAMRLASMVKYRNVGTVEFIYDMDSEEFYFLEVNTRLQVEHPVTESVTGLDLVQVMLDVAGNESEDLFQRFSPSNSIPVSGVSIEVRVYAEDPLDAFQPCSGLITNVRFPDELRVDTWIENGTKISATYDPMVAKLISTGKDRAEALRKLSQGLTEMNIEGVKTNLEYLRQVVSSLAFQSGSYTTMTLDTFQLVAPSFQVLEPGGHMTIQDFPGRVGYWNVGVPPSGPMDHFSFRLANRLVNNDAGLAALECTIRGPVLKFHCAAVIAITGATCTVSIDDKSVPMHRTLRIEPGQILTLGVFENGCRVYIAVSGGIDVPLVFGSRATFDLGKLGGYYGSSLGKGHIVPLHPDDSIRSSSSHVLQVAPPVPIPSQPNAKWTIGVIPGPHSAPDIFTAQGLRQLFNDEWKVHYNSNRLGIRLTGPHPTWARENGAGAGLHPSNIHDTPYSIGSVSFTGDEAIVLTCDGPSLGGFVVFCVVASGELWKLGQLRPGDVIQFEPIQISQAFELQSAVDQSVLDLTPLKTLSTVAQDYQDIAIRHTKVGELCHEGQKVVVRQAGDCQMLLEFGNDFEIRQSAVIFTFLKLHETNPILGVEELSPGVCSIHVKYAAQTYPDTILSRLFTHIRMCNIPQQIPSRTFRLPLAFNDESSQRAVERYQATIRGEAPWLPSNVKFLEQLNGINDLQPVLEETTFLVLGLGDVFLGSPCAVPLDPRHRLHGTKYNPSRSSTPRGSVGIGGQYMCIYGIDSPGGYQLVGRTVNIWDLDLASTVDLETDRNLYTTKVTPWLFRLFDRISFYSVIEAELDSKPAKELIQVSDSTFDLTQYETWLEDNREDIEKRDKQLGQARDRVSFLEELMKPYKPTDQTQIKTYNLGGQPVKATMPGRCWKVPVKEGEEVKKGAVLVYLECSKMEIEICSPADGVVASILVSTGAIVDALDTLIVLRF